MIEIARRRQPRGAGSDIRALMCQARRPLPVNVADILEGVPYAVVGGVATRAYMPERFTRDIDVLVSFPFYDAAKMRLRAHDWRSANPLRFPGSSLALQGQLWTRGEVELDLITSEQQWADEACSTSAADQFGTRIVTLPYLILMKLDASRPQDTADVTRMLALADDPLLALTREVIGRYARDSETSQDLESLLEIGRWELDR